MVSKENKQVTERKLGLNGSKAEPRPTSDFCGIQGKRTNGGLNYPHRIKNINYSYYINYIILTIYIYKYIDSYKSS